MNPRKRVLTAINHQEPDRVPVDYWATPETDNKLHRHFNTKTRNQLFEKLNVDIRYVKPIYKGGKFEEHADGSLHRKGESGEYIDIWGVVRKYVSLGETSYLEVQKSPLEGATTVGEIEKYNFPGPDDFDYQSVERSCKGYENYAVICTGDRLTTRASIFKLAMYLRRMDKLLMDLALNPKFAQALIDKLLEFHLEHNRRTFAESADKIDIFMLGDDFGAQDGPLISLEMFRKFFKPALKKLIDLGHRFNLKVMLHSCGGIKPLIPDLIEIGLDVLNPIQTKAKDMDPKKLKKEFGKDLSFHGSVDVQHVLPFGTIKEVEEEVKQCIDALAPRGGFILAPAHNIQPDVPIENILALYNTARKFGRY